MMSKITKENLIHMTRAEFEKFFAHCADYVYVPPQPAAVHDPAPAITAPRMQKKIGRPPGSKNKAPAAAGKERRNGWNERDIRFLQENYSTLRIVDIALKIDKTPTAVSKMAYKLGLRKYVKKEQVIGSS